MTIHTSTRHHDKLTVSGMENVLFNVEDGDSTVIKVQLSPQLFFRGFHIDYILKKKSGGRALETHFCFVSTYLRANMTVLSLQD